MRIGLFCFASILFGISVVQYAETLDGGVLLFLRAGTQVSLSDAWENISLTDTANINKHEWAINSFIQDGQDFRSPLIDLWEEVEVVEIFLRCFNSNGWEIRDFQLLPGQSSDVGSFVPRTDYMPQAQITENELNPKISINKIGFPDQFSLFMYYQYPRQDLNFGGQQFLFSTHYNQEYSALPESTLQGCYKIKVSGSVVHTVTKVFQCTAICLGSSELQFFITATATGFGCVCLPQNIISMSLLSSDSCSSVCQDALPCGSTASYWDVGNTFPEVSLYTLDPVIRDLRTIHNADNTSVTDTHISDTSFQISFDPGVYIVGMTVSEPYVNELQYELKFSFDRCPDAPNHPWHSYTTLGGDVKTFKINQVYNLEPTFAHCLNISIEFVKTYFHVSVKYITADFLYAPYVAVIATWENRTDNAPVGCAFNNLMVDNTSVAENNIDIRYQAVPVYATTFPDPSFRIVPSVAIDRLTAYFLNDPEFWVENVTVWSDQDLSVTGRLTTSQFCTDQNSGGSVRITGTSNFNANFYAGAHYSTNFALLKGNDRMYCVSTFTLVSRMTRPADGPSTFELEVILYGCTNQQGETTISSCQAYNLLADTAMESRVFVKWQPLQDYATQAVRTNGQGLLMHTKMSPSVWISSVADNIMVKQVNIFGNVWSANITAGDMHAVFKKSTDIDVASLDEPIAAVLDSAIAVSQIGIQPLQLEGSGADFYNYTVVVLGCLLDVSTTTQVSPTSALSSAPMTSGPSSVSDQPSGFPPNAPTLTSRAGTTYKSPTTDSPTTTTINKQSTKPPKTPSPTTAVPGGNGLHLSNESSICCPTFCTSNTTLTDEEIEDKIEELIAILTIPKTNISALRRKKISAEDSRPSATGVGVCGIAVLALAGVFIVFMDMDHVIALMFFVKNAYKELKKT